MYRLTYWQKRGRGEQVRLLLHELDLDYEEVYVVEGSPGFVAMQKAGPRGGLAFQSVPMLDDDGFQLVQGPVILGYLARKHGLVDATDLKTASWADAIAWGAEDIRLAYFTMFGAGGPARQQAFVEGRYRNRWLPAFETLLDMNGDNGFFVGDDITHADIAVWDILDSMQEWVAGARDAMAEFPRVQRFFETIAARPRIAAYLASDQRPRG